MKHTPRSLLGLTATIAMLGSSPPSNLHGQARSRPGNDSFDLESSTRRTPGIPRSRQRLAPVKDQYSARGAPGSVETVIPREFRSIDGAGNNQRNPAWGARDQLFLRLIPPAYEDGLGIPSGNERPSARAISNAVCSQVNFASNQRGATDFLWQWGQFLDHDIVETPSLDPPEAFDILVPAGDPWFDPTGSGSQTIALNRSFHEMKNGVREQVNAITAYIDASNVYGSDDERAYALRTLDGSGKLKSTTSDFGSLLPYNTGGFDNAGGSSNELFLAGDVRANEQVALTAMHTLFMREHNYWAQHYADLNPASTDEETYQFARMIVGAEMQAITYREFLPVLLGTDAIPPYRGYRPDLDASITNIFATASYRFGHSLLSPTLLRLDPEGDEVEAGHIPLASAFFQPSHIEGEGIDSLLRGLAAQPCQELDGQLVDGLRNFLFGPPGSGGFDLASLNIQRGRDHGLPSFTEACRALGQRPPRTFRDINPDPLAWQALEKAYGDVTQIDCWVGGLCQQHVPGAMVGPMLQRTIAEQFIRLRDGDRFYYEHYLPRELVGLVEAQTLSRIIRRNTDIGNELPENVFVSPIQSVLRASPNNPRRPPRRR